MNSLLATAEIMLIDRVLGNDVPFTGKSKAGLSLYALAGTLFVTSLGFFIVAAYLWIENNYFPPEKAAAMAGGLILALSCLCAGAAYLILQYKRSRARKLKAELTQTLHTLADIAEEELSQPIKDNPKTSVLIASLAGFIAGDKFL